MSSPEDIFHRPHVVFAPDDKTDGVPNSPTDNSNPTQSETKQQADSNHLSLKPNHLILDSSESPPFNTQLEPQPNSLLEKNQKDNRQAVTTGADYIPASEEKAHHPDVSQTAIVKSKPEQLKQAGSEIIGRADFRWRRDLSEDGKKLYLLLLKEMGDRDLLPAHAVNDKFDLNIALNELRKHGLLDESNFKRIRLINRKL